jgi:formate hydrogenlyase subunit 6/NADH:ubiquinone oxidoreductase subunit I
MIPELLKQLFKKPFTNKFPVKYIPDSTTKFLDEVKKGKKINPPIDVPPNFRGKIKYDRKKCIGCGLCARVCPSNAIELIPEKKKIKIYVARCTFCSQCTDVCPKKALTMSDEWLLADTDKYSDNLIVE